MKMNKIKANLKFKAYNKMIIYMIKISYKKKFKQILINFN